MGESRTLPDRWADVPAGAEFAAALAAVDRCALSADELLDLAAARARFVAQAQAALLADVLAAGRAAPRGLGAGRRNDQELDEFAADEIAFTLRWSRSFARGQLDLAEDLICRLPMVYEALAAGSIDLARARVFAEMLVLVDDELARRIAGMLVGKAPSLTLSQLRARLRYQLLKAQPGLARRRYQHGLAERDVWTGQRDDGTGFLCGSHLPVDRAAAADDRLSRLARAAKAAGDTRTLAQLRADAFLDLLAGVPFAVRPSTDPITEATDPQARGRAAAAGIDLDRSDLPAASERAMGHRPVATGEAAGGDGPEEPIGRAVLGEHSDPSRPVTAGADGRLCVCGRVQPGPRRGVVDLQVKLSTLMCLDEDPGLIPGWGPVIADIARQVARDRNTRPAWAWSVTDEAGNLLHHGFTRRRPTAAERAFVNARDRTCRAPGCTRPAVVCDQDHYRVQAKDGGPAHRGNTCVLCRRHHRLRHERGHAIHQLSPGLFIWQSPTGRHYLITPNGDLILTADDPHPTGESRLYPAIFSDHDEFDLGPPPGYVNAIFAAPRAPAGAGPG